MGWISFSKSTNYCKWLWIFKEIIQNGISGILCKTKEDWYKELKALLSDEHLRKTNGNNAFEICNNQYNSVTTGNRLVNYIHLIARKHIGFFLPSLQISGGVKVVLVYSSFLQEEGYDVDLIVPDSNDTIFEFQGHKFNIISLNKAIILCQYDIVVAALFSTLF